MARPPSTQPTDGELEILNVLWEAGPSGLGRVHEMLSTRRPVALTTVATMLKTMRSKGLVVRGDGPKGHVYTAALTHDDAAAGLVGKLLRHVFDGSARRLVAHLIREGTLDENERQEVLALLNASDSKRATQIKERGAR
jgi:predicted transcriptional regulator